MERIIQKMQDSPHVKKFFTVNIHGMDIAFSQIESPADSGQRNLRNLNPVSAHYGRGCRAEQRSSNCFSSNNR
jgi:hypothetical protein